MKLVIVSGTRKPHGPDCACFVCPQCGATEVNDCTLPNRDDWRFQIRMNRVQMEDGHWYSHCTVCDKWFRTEEG